MERSHGREFQTMSRAPLKKPVADRGGEEVNVGFADFEAGRGNKLRDPRWPSLQHKEKLKSNAIPKDNLNPSN
jgi:hypothetical protein